MKFLMTALVLLSAPGTLEAQRLVDDQGRVQVALVKMPYTGGRNVPEISDVPDYLEGGGIVGLLEGQGASLRPMVTVGLTADQERDYGPWHRMAMANGHLAGFAEQSLRANYLHVGLLANCTSLIGVLGGMQKVATSPERIGLVFIDAHGDFNTPETTLSGMLGGMPVAVAAGLGLHILRNESGLPIPIPTENIVLGAARDLDPLERALVEEHQLTRFSTEDIIMLSPKLHRIMEDLSARTDLIYVHIDMDVLDPDEVPGHPLTVPNGPTSEELAAAIALMFTYEKAVAFGVASTPANERDPDGVSRQAAYRLIQGAVDGVKRRAMP